MNKSVLVLIFLAGTAAGLAAGMPLGFMAAHHPKNAAPEAAAPLPFTPPPAAAQAPAPAAAFQKPDPRALQNNGRPFLGPENAPVTIVEFSDFHCPFCTKLSPVLDELMKNYAGKVKRVWRHFPLPMHKGAEKTHEAAECARDGGKFWEYRDKLFQTTGRPRTEEELVRLAQELGLEPGAFQSCLASGKYREVVKADAAKAAELGVNSTPTVFINGYKFSGAYPYSHFENAVKQLLAGKPLEIPAPDAARPPVKAEFNDLAGKPSLGPENAPVTMVEFSDLHCPFCKKISPTLDQLMKNYAGKIRRVFRHFPLPMHTGAEKTHQATECAREGGKFWEYKDKVFETMGGPRDEAALVGLARELGLEPVSFESCLKSGKYAEAVKKDMAKGSASGVRGTPAVFINGELVSGARPYASFEKIVQEKLSKT